MKKLGNFRKAFANNSSANIKLSKTQLSKIIQSSQFLDCIILRLASNMIGNTNEETW